MNGKNLILALEMIEKEKGIPKEAVIQGIKEAIDRAYKKEVDPEATVDVVVDQESGDITVFKLMKVVKSENLEDDLTEISLEDARKIDVKLGLNDFYRKPLPIADFSRIAALHVKQVIKQKISEAQKDILFDEWSPKIGSVINAEVEKIDGDNSSILVNLGSTLGFVPPIGTIKNEKLVPGQMYKFFVQDVKKISKGFPIILSRSAPGFVKYLLTLESPEIQDGTVEIMSVSRDAGNRAKIAVKSNNPSVDAVGACVGKKGSRINTISAQLNGEKIDVVPWDENPVRFIINAMAPSQVVSVVVIEQTESFKDATVVVPDDQLSLAIGKKGSTARLAAQLTGWNLDIKSLSQANEEGIEFVENGNMNEPRKIRSPRVANIQRQPTSSFKKENSYPSSNTSGTSSPKYSSNRGSNKQFDIGNVFDDETLDKYEQQAKKAPRVKDIPANKKETSREELEAFDNVATTSDDSFEEIDNTDFDDLYEKK